MRRSRRGGHSSVEFGSSGEDSFVAVVVTKLTGALLFILLLTMVIMALLPKAADLESLDSEHREAGANAGQAPLRIATPSRLPEAVAGRPYLLALAATGGGLPRTWSSEGALPDWLALDPASGQIAGTPPRETDSPLSLTVQVSDGTDTVSQPVSLSVLPYQATAAASWWSRLPSVPLAHVARARIWLPRALARPSTGDERSQQPRAGRARGE